MGTLGATIRKFLGWTHARATWADQAEAEADNALKEVTDAAEGYQKTNKSLIESHKELRKSVSSFEPFVQIERVMKEDHRLRNGVRIR